MYVIHYGHIQDLQYSVQNQPTERCEAAWQEAWTKFESKQELF